MGPLEEDYIETVLTCEGDFYDPEFHTQLQDFSNRLQNLITTEEKQKLIIKKVEPWNSVRVTFNIPKEAAIRLKHLAEQGDQTLRQLGVLAVQIEGDRVISLTIAGKNNETTEVVFHTAGAGASSGTGAGASSLFDVSGSDEPGPSNVEATRKNIAHYLSQQGGAGNIFESILNHGANGDKAHGDPLSIQRQQAQFPFSSPNRSPSSTVNVQVPFPTGRSPTGFPSPSASQLQQNFPSPGSGRNHVSPGSPKFSTPPPPPQVLNPNSPGSRQGQVNFPLPFPHVNPNVNNLQRLVAAGGKDITSSSPLLVNLLQSDVAAGHFNNLPQHRSPFSFEPAGPAVKRKRRPRKSKDGSPKVPKLGDSDEASIPLPGTFPGISSQPHMENRVPPMGVEAAFYNVPNSLANSTGSETRASVTPPSGAQVHTPPLVERSHGNQGGPLSNQVSPNSSGTLSVSTPSPVRTTPERSLGNNGLQQMINPYTGQLEPVENSPSERTHVKSENSGDNSALDVPPQLQPPPNPLVALENRLAAGSQSLSLPSQLPSSPRTIDSSLNKNLSNPAHISNAAGALVSSPHLTTMPPVSTTSDSMQSKTALPASVPGVPHHVRLSGNSSVSAPEPSHRGPDLPPTFTSSTLGNAVSSSALSSSLSNRARHQGPTEIHAIPRHPQVQQHSHAALRPPGNAPGAVSSEMRHLPTGMGHPELRLRMPQHHSAGIQPHMAVENHGMPNYPNMPRSQASGMSGAPSVAMHNADSSVGTSRGVLTGHPRMPHPQHQHPMPPGYYQHMQQQRARLPMTNTVSGSAAQAMTSNSPSRLSQTIAGTSNSVIASQLMRPTLAAGSSLGMSIPNATSVGSAQMTHPAIASQLSQSNSSPTKVPLPRVDSQTSANSSFVATKVVESSTKLKVTTDVKESDEPKTIPASETDSSNSKEGEDAEKSTTLPASAKQTDSEPPTSKSQPSSDNESVSNKISSVIDTSSGSKAAAHLTVSDGEKNNPLHTLPPSNVSGVSNENRMDSIQVSSQLTNSDVTATEGLDKTTEKSGATGGNKNVNVVENEMKERTTDTQQDITSRKSDTSERELNNQVQFSASREEEQRHSSPLLEIGPNVPGSSQDSDSPPTTSSPGDSDGTPILDSCHESKLGDVSKLQPSPPHVRTTLSAIAMHNDLHNLVRGSNGASTGEASPVSDNLSSTSQQNYGQSPLGNNVGMHMNHDSELSSQSFDDNSSTPPHAQSAVGQPHAATFAQENHSDGATKSKDTSNPSKESSLPKDQPAATVPETKNIITIGYAVSNEPILRKDLTDAVLNPSSKTLDDIPYLKKPSVDLNEENGTLKGVSLSDDFLNEKPNQAQSAEGSVKRVADESIPKESLNYRGQVPLFSRTMETCDLNPGGKISRNLNKDELPVNGDVDGIKSDTASDTVPVEDANTGKTSACPDQSAAIYSKTISSSNSVELEDAEVPGESVEMNVSSEKNENVLLIHEKCEQKNWNEENLSFVADPADEKILTDVIKKDNTLCVQKDERNSPTKEETEPAPSELKEENDQSEDILASEEKMTEVEVETEKQQTTSTGEKNEIQPQEAPVTQEKNVVTSTTPVDNPPEQQPILSTSSEKMSTATSTYIKKTTETRAVSPQDVIRQKESAVCPVISVLKTAPNVGPVMKVEDSTEVIGTQHTTLDNSGNPSSIGDQLKSEDKVKPDKNTAKVIANVSTDDKKEFHVFMPEKPVRESPIKDLQSRQSPPVTIATAQLQNRTNTLEKKLSVAVVSNNPPTVTTSAMNKSISPVIKAVSSSKPVDIVTSVSVPSTVTVTTNTTLSTTGSAIFTGSITLPIVTSVIRPSLPPVCCHTSTIPGSKPPLVSSSNVGQYKKISHQVDNTKLPPGTGHISVNPSVVTTLADKHILDITTSVPAVTTKSRLLVTNAQSRTVSSVPMQAKVRIVTTVGNTKVAIHTLNSVAEPTNVHQITASHRAVLKPSIIQTTGRVQNALNDNVSKVGGGTSIMIRDITRTVDSKNDNSTADSKLAKLDVSKPKIQAGAIRSEETAQSKPLLSKDSVFPNKQIERIAGQSGKIIHYNLHQGQRTIPSLTQTVSKPHEVRETLHDQIDSIVNASRNINQNVTRVSPVGTTANQKGVAVNTSAVSTTLQSKVTTIKQPGVSAASSVEQTQELISHAGRMVSGQLVSNVRSGQLPATSNLESGTATAAIQAVAAHVKAAQSAASHTPTTSPPPEQQKRQSKGISILKPLYDKEFELDDSEMDPKVNVPQSSVAPKKLSNDSQVGSKSVDENTTGNVTKTTYDTAFSIAQILDHAKRAMAEEKQQKESKASAMKEKSKTSVGKGPKPLKPVKSQPTIKGTGQPTATVAAPSPVPHDFPFGSNVHLSNFAQKSKQTPTVVNSTVHTPAHPIMSPEFHLNLTESVQKVMQAIPGSDALSPPPCPPKVVRPGSVFTKFNEDKEETNADSQSSTQVSTTCSVSTASNTISTPVVVNTSIASDISSAPVTSHKVSVSLPPTTALIVSPSTKTTTITSPHKSPTPPAVTPPRTTPTPPSAMSALRNTPTPPAAVVPSTQQVVSRKTPTPPAATVPPTMVRKAPTPPAALSQPHTNARVVSPHSIVNRNTPTPPYNRNTPTPPGTSTVIHSRSPHSTPPAKEIPKVKGPGVKFEIMSQPHGASTIVVIKSDNKDSTPPPTSDATQTIILGQKDLIRKTTVSSGKSDNVTVITTHKPDQFRKVAPTIIVPSSSAAASTSAMTMSSFSIQKQSAASVLTPKVQQSHWKRADVTLPSVRSVTPQTAQMSRVTTVMKGVPLQSRIGQAKPITAITVVNPMKQVFVGTTVSTIGTPTATSAVATIPRTSVCESNVATKQMAPEAVPTTSPVRLLVTTVKPPVTDVNPPAVESEVSVVTSKEDDLKTTKPEFKPLKVDEVAPLKIDDTTKVSSGTSQISPKIDSIEQETKVIAKRTSRKRSADKEIEKVEVEQEQPNNNNKSEKTAKKSSESSHVSDEAPRPARVNRRRSRESTESQQSTANSESGRSTRSTRRRGASESSDISISSDGHNTDMRSTPSTRSSVDRSESPPRTTSRHSTRSTTRKRTSAEREEATVPSTAKASTGEKERSLSPAPGKGTRTSKRKLTMDEDDHDTKKLKIESTSGQADSRTVDTNENDTRSRRTAVKQDTGKGTGNSNIKEPVTTPASRRTGSRSQKTENVEPTDDHTYSGTRRTNTRSTGPAMNQDAKGEAVQKKAPAAVKKVAEDKTTGRNKGKQTVTEEKDSVTEEVTDATAKRSTRSTRNKDRTELPPPPPSTKRQRMSRDH